MVPRSPVPSMPKPVTGLPVLAMPSTTRLVQPSSMPITTTAATLGFAPVPIRVRKCSSRSAPNCSLPYACGSAIVPLMLLATASLDAFDRSSSGRMITWLRTPTRPFSRRHAVTWLFPFWFFFFAMMSPALGLEVLDVDVLALLHRRDEAADVFAVLDRRISGLEIVECHLVADRNVVLHRDRERRVVLGDDAERIGAGTQALHHDHRDVVLRTVGEDVRDAVSSGRGRGRLPGCDALVHAARCSRS